MLTFKNSSSSDSLSFSQLSCKSCSFLTFFAASLCHLFTKKELKSELPCRLSLHILGGGQETRRNTGKKQNQEIEQEKSKGDEVFTYKEENKNEL